MKKQTVKPYWIKTGCRMEGPFETTKEATDWARLWVGYNPWVLLVEYSAVQAKLEAEGVDLTRKLETKHEHTG